MIELILLAVMAVSLIGMVAAGINDPLSRRFWEDMRNGKREAARRRAGK